MPSTIEKSDAGSLSVFSDVLVSCEPNLSRGFFQCNGWLVELT